MDEKKGLNGLPLKYKIALLALELAAKIEEGASC